MKTKTCNVNRKFKIEAYVYYISKMIVITW